MKYKLVANKKQGAVDFCSRANRRFKDAQEMEKKDSN